MEKDRFQITMAGEFSECYSFTFPPKTDGVVPSLFGVANIIDGTLWHSGVIVGQGLPIIAHVPGAKGFSHLRLKGGPISVVFDGDSVALSGEGLAGLALPSGFKVENGKWTGKLAVGEELALKGN